MRHRAHAVAPAVRSVASHARRAAAAAFFLALAIGSASAEVSAPPHYDHVVVVVFENRAYEQIQSSPDAAFFHELARRGALFVDSHAVSHPSEPNYLALFSGSTQGVSDDGVHTFDRPDLAGDLAGAGKTFLGYVEKGSPGKHNPWESFANAASLEAPMETFPSDFSTLPAVSFVIPNLWNDMHDGPIGAGDAWLRAHLGAYADWAQAHDALLIVTFDEDDGRHANHVFTVFVGAHIRPGIRSQKIDHYDVLRTIEAIEVLPKTNSAGAGQAITAPWERP